MREVLRQTWKVFNRIKETRAPGFGLKLQFGGSKRNRETPSVIRSNNSEKIADFEIKGFKLVRGKLNNAVQRLTTWFKIFCIDFVQRELA